MKQGGAIGKIKTLKTVKDLGGGEIGGPANLNFQETSGACKGWVKREKKRLETRGV